MSTSSEKAVTTFKETFNCAQAVIAAFCEDFAMDRATALRVATAFGGGMAGMGLTCGAVTGAYMVIGLKHGRTDAADHTPAEKASATVQEFNKRFLARNKSIACRELLGVDTSTPEGKAYALEMNLREKVCAKAVRDAAEVLEELFSE